MRISPLAGTRGRDACASSACGGCRVTNRAVAFDMATHAGADVSFGLPSVMPGRPRAVCPFGFRRMEASAPGRVRERPGHRDAGPLVAGQTKRLLAMAARALLLIFPGRDGMHVQPVVRVNATGTNPAVVAVGTVFLAVTIAAEAAVVTSDGLVSQDPIGPMPGVVEPVGR